MDNAVVSSEMTDTEDLLALKAQYLIPCVYHFYRNPPRIVSGRGCQLVDHRGREYIDCFSGVTVMNAGHCNAAIIEPAIAQIRTLQHTTSLYLTEPVLRLAEALADIMPDGLTRSFFCSSGSEAVEGALLLAALHMRRRCIIAMTESLHGRTRWAMSVTGLDMWRTDPFAIDDVFRVPFGDLDALSCVLERWGNVTAAVIAEPIQGNGGIRVPPPAYWPAVRRLCDQHNVLLVFDEVQTGMNRTGRWYACEHWSVAPDILVTSKALGNGFPISAFATTDAIAASYTRPGASTHGGNPVSAAAALATIEFHRQHHLGQRATELGEKLFHGIRRIVANSACLDHARGMGLMIGVDVVDDRGQAAPALCDEILEQLKDRGVLVGKSGAHRNVLTFLPPLTISENELGAVLHALEQVCV